MIYTLGNLITDLLIFIDHFPVQAQDLQGVSQIDIGPGGACNVAIMSSRFGLPTSCLGEIGDDIFGRLLLDSLARENIHTDAIQINHNKATPVAGVLVDPKSEPAYLGYPGQPQIDYLPSAWPPLLAAAQSVFVDGWIEYEDMASVNLTALQIAHKAGVPIFFDPGPGNPRQDNTWHQAAAERATVILATESEIQKLLQVEDALQGARRLLENGCQLVVIKRGENGAIFMASEQSITLPGLPVDALDATGAGDSLAAAVIYATLNQYSLTDLAHLANATGAAKVQKKGTGHNLPTMAEIKKVMKTFSIQIPQFT